MWGDSKLYASSVSESSTFSHKNLCLPLALWGEPTRKKKRSLHIKWKKLVMKALRMTTWVKGRWAYHGAPGLVWEQGKQNCTLEEVSSPTPCHVFKCFWLTLGFVCKIAPNKFSYHSPKSRTANKSSYRCHISNCIADITDQTCSSKLPTSWWLICAS